MILDGARVLATSLPLNVFVRLSANEWYSITLAHKSNHTDEEKVLRALKSMQQFNVTALNPRWLKSKKNFENQT